MVIAHCKHTRIALLLAVTLVAGCGQQDEPAGSLEPGQEPYLRYCASCHGNQGEGRPPAFPPLAGSEWLELPSEALAGIVLRGLRGDIEVAGQRYRGFMPPLRHIGDEDIAAIIGYMRSRWNGPGDGIDAAGVTELRSAISGAAPFQGREDVEAMLEERS